MQTHTQVGFTLEGDEILVNVHGMVHSIERLYTDVIFETNKGRKFVCRSASRTNSSVLNLQVDRNLLESVSFCYEEKKKGWGRKKDSGGDVEGTTGILGIRAAVVTTHGNMTGLAGLSCIVTKFTGVDEDVAEEWTEEEMARIKNIEQMKKARELGEKRASFRQIWHFSHWRFSHYFAHCFALLLSSQRCSPPSRQTKRKRMCSSIMWVRTTRG